MKLHKAMAVTSLLLILLTVNALVYQQEKLLSDGEKILLKLRVVDSRSLMQGDYMALDYELAAQIRMHLAEQRHDVDRPLRPQDAFVVVKVDKDNVAEFVRIDNDQPLAGNERRLFFRVRNNSIKFGTNAFFFEEGTASNYQDAQFAEFRVNQEGDLLLVNVQ
ncbi:GDYXXLXY domain-containing protein [Methylophaga sp.]|uniref:GDYXXLXY domain-containing protein n=1 Tax=Methylophaga sp. TaxID=2024840 RepID=UPI003A938E3B